jgi:hypothetical protein
MVPANLRFKLEYNRVYTLLPPAFYQALYQFNWNNPMPLFRCRNLAEEHPVNSDYLNQEYNRTTSGN